MVRDRSTLVRRDAWIRVADGTSDMGLNNHTDRTAAGEKLRIAGIQALSAMGEAAASAVPDLVDALKDEEPDVRRFAARTIGSVGPRAAQAVPALIELLQSSTRQRRLDGGRPELPVTLLAEAAMAIGKIGPKARAAVPFLVKAMNDRDEVLRLAAADALGEIGPADPSVIPALERAMTSVVHEDLAQQAAMALGAIGEASLPVLIRALHDRDPNVRARSAQALARIGGAAKAVLPELDRALADDDPDVRQAIEAAIEQIRNPEPEAGFKTDPEAEKGSEPP
jgi:HEAT repeat protein